MRNIILFVLLAAASAEHVQLGFTKNVLQPFKLKQSVSTLERTGKPSFKPTRNPVLEFSPSEAPTGSPTYGTGWLIVNRNQGSCDVTPDSVLAVRTETCIKSYADNEDEFPYYIRASCYTDSAYVQFYYDEECTEQFEEGGIADIELGCETNEDSRFSSAYTFCSTDENDLPLSDFHSYSVLLGYGAHDGTCADDNIVKLLAWKDSACMSDEEGHSASIVWPDVYTYGSNEFCNGTDFTVTPIRKPDECVATQVLLNETSMTYGDANVTEGAFEGYYAGFQDTSNWQGSVKWIAFTARDDNLHFTAKQEVLGILPTDFNDNFDANEAVWANAIASTIGNGITADDVEITRLDLEIYELRRRSLSEGSTDVTYKVSFEAGKLEFYSEDEAYETLATALIAGVESGNFTMYLQEWNAELTTEESSGDLGDCSSSKVRVEYDGAPNPEDDDNDGSKWAERASANIISGVIIGIGIVLLAGLAFYAFKQCSAKKE